MLLSVQLAMGDDINEDERCYQCFSGQRVKHIKNGRCYQVFSGQGGKLNEDKRCYQWFSERRRGGIKGK